MPISVVMPVYNAEPYLAQAIQSILDQTWVDFEFIIIDNGCTDASSEIIKSFAGKDPRIRVLTNPSNVGPPRALNQGLQMAGGKYIARMDADDIALPDRLSKQWRFMEDHPRCGALGAQAIFIDEDGKEMYAPWHPVLADAIKWRLLFTSPLAHSSTMMRKEAVLSVDGYNESLRHASDYALWSRLMAQGYEIANLDAPLMRIRVHQQSDGMTARGRPEVTDEMVSVGRANVSELLGIKVSEGPFLALTMLLRKMAPPPGVSANLSPKVARVSSREVSREVSGEVSDPIKLLDTMSRAFGPRSRPLYGLSVIGIAMSAPLGLGARAKLVLQGLIALTSFRSRLWGYRLLWREWIANGRLLGRALYEIRRAM